MKQSIEKFILSLRVPVNKVCIRDVKCINDHTSPTNSIEVYHGTRGINSTLENVNDTNNKIIQEGFKIPTLSNFSNKGDGIYFSSHARYQYLWLGDNVPIFICDLQYKKDEVKRYRSEVSIGSEYCVTHPSLIKIKYLISYKVEDDRRNDPEIINNHHSIYIPHGQFGCKICDPKEIRCDCEQFPTFLKD